MGAVHRGLCGRAGGAAADEERSSRGRPAAAAEAEAEVLQREKSCLETSKVSHFFAFAPRMNLRFFSPMSRHHIPVPEACNVIPGGAVVRLAYHAWWYGMGVGALHAGLFRA